MRRPRVLAPVAELLRRCVEPARESVRWVASLRCPELEVAHEPVALLDDRDYPLERGRLGSSEGLDLSPEAFESTFAEHQAKHSTALLSRRLGHGSSFLVGALALRRNAPRLSPLACEAAIEAGCVEECVGLTLPVREAAVRLAATLRDQLS